MLISINLSPHDLWQQKQDLLDQIHSLANDSIFDDPKEKDRLKMKFLEFIYSNRFDPIYGGLIISSELDNDEQAFVLYHKPLVANLYLNELFMAASQAFYDGEINHHGKLIFNYLIEQLKNSRLEYNNHCRLESLKNFYSQEQIDNQLNNKEQELFFALMLEENHSNDGYLFSYKQPLKQAANFINMEYKEAQILAFSIKEKLKGIQIEKEAEVKKRIPDIFLSKCEFMISLASHDSSSLIVDHKRLLFELFHSLFIQIKDPKNSKYWIDLIVSGIYLLQLNFDLELLSKLENLTSNFIEISKINNGTNDKRTEFRSELIIQFFATLHNGNLLSDDFEEVWLNFNGKSKGKFEFILLDANQVGLDAQLVDIKSKYNPYRLIFLT